MSDPVKVGKVRKIPLSKLRPALWNANRVPKPILAKIKRSIETFGFVENLVARPHPTEDKAFEVLSGNHRLQLLAELGQKTAPVVVVDLDDDHAKLLAQVLNRTRGRDDKKAYRQLIEELLQVMSAEEVAALLPESPRSLEDARGDAPTIVPEPIWGVIVDCQSEEDQVELLDKLITEGRECRALLT